MLPKAISQKHALLSLQKCTDAKSSPTGESSDLQSPIQHGETETVVVWDASPPWLLTKCSE